MNAYFRCLRLVCCLALLLALTQPCPTRADNAPAGASMQRLFPGATKQVLDQSRHLTLFALDPQQRGSFHGYKVLHERQITDKKLVAEVVKALYAGVADKNAVSKKCFSPHHGLRAWGDRRQTVDLVICFTCGNIYSHSGPQNGSAAISTSPEPVFNQILKK